ECPIELLLLLEFGSLFFQLLDVGHVGQPGNFDLPGRHYLRGTRVQLTYVFVGVTRRASLPRPDTKTCAVPVWQLSHIPYCEEGQISRKTGCNLPSFVSQSERRRPIHRSRNQGFRQAHPQLTYTQREHQGKVNS